MARQCLLLKTKLSCNTIVISYYIVASYIIRVVRLLSLPLDGVWLANAILATKWCQPAHCSFSLQLATTIICDIIYSRCEITTPIVMVNQKQYNAVGIYHIGC